MSADKLTEQAIRILAGVCGLSGTVLVSIMLIAMGMTFCRLALPEIWRWMWTR